VLGKTLKGTTRLFVGLAALVVLTGCTSYWRHRAEDFADTFDIGLTFSKKPQFAFYNSFESIVALGYANYEATFVGWGGNRFGATRHYLKAWGALVWADEEAGWGNYDKNDRSTLYCQTVGIVGMPVGMITGNSNPHYVPT
jgi:hypothetical protein